jgi:hypothetical protein
MTNLRDAIAATLRTLLLLAPLLVLLAPEALAQQSSRFILSEWTINDGGDPLNGSSAASASFHVTLDAIGDGVVATGLGSASWHLDSGFVDVYAPPGEVQGQLFTNAMSMTWIPEKSVGEYEVYRGLLSGLPGGYGACFLSALASAAATDSGAPPLGDGWFYLVTAKNRLGEEGTKGYDSNGAMRANPSPCP